MNEITLLREWYTQNRPFLNFSRIEKIFEIPNTYLNNFISEPNYLSREALPKMFDFAFSMGFSLPEKESVLDYDKMLFEYKQRLKQVKQ